MVENLFDAELFSEFFDNQSQALLWLEPEFDNKGAIVNFIYTYANNRGLDFLNTNREELKNLTVFNSPYLSNDLRYKIFDEMVQVYETGITSETSVYNPAVKKYGRVSRSKFRNGILNTIHDSTEENSAILKLEKQTKELESQRSFSNSILDASANGIFALEAILEEDDIVDFKIVKVNKAFCEIIGQCAEEVEGKSYLSLYPGSKQAGTFALNCAVVKTGEPMRKEMHYASDGLNAWYDISLVKWGDNGLVATFSDITERKQSELEREQNNLLVQTMLNASFHGKALVAPLKNAEGEIIDFTVVATNNSTQKQIGILPSDAIGKTMSELLPNFKNNGAFDRYKNAIATNKAARYEQLYEDERLQAWFDIYISPVSNGIVISFENITKSKQEALRTQQQKNLLDAIMSHSPSGISVTQMIRNEQNEIVDGRTIIANEAAVEYVGLPKELFLSKTIKEIDPNILESPLYKLTKNTLETGEVFRTQYYFEQTNKWLELSVAKMDDDSVINVFTDVTTTKEVQLQIESFADKLNTVIDTSQTGFFLSSPVFDADGEIIDFRFTLVNRMLALFVGKQPHELVGELASTWFITYKRNGMFERFKETWLTGKRQQFDIHYTGEIAEVWANIVSTRLEDELLGSFTDFTPIKKLQFQLEKSVEQLVRSNENLEAFAYAASHDLQEPLRKINFFSDQLRRDLHQQLTEDNIRKFDRMQNATDRMRILINDLLEFSKLSSNESVSEDVTLSDVVDQVLQDLEATVIKTDADIQVEKLPVVKGDEQQLASVFQNILSNALKYRKVGVAPTISITSRLVDETDPAFATISDVRKGNYYLLAVSDNGIGFEQEQAEKIFQVFQRLHGRSEYEGTGVGLAIVQKIINHHRGYITAVSEEGKGSTFFIMLPA